MPVSQSKIRPQHVVASVHAEAGGTDQKGLPAVKAGQMYGCKMMLAQVSLAFETAFDSAPSAVDNAADILELLYETHGNPPPQPVQRIWLDCHKVTRHIEASFL